jgi:thiamine pyrophosphate-dependent acetolactate synthase large subunit-like protein
VDLEDVLDSLADHRTDQVVIATMSAGVYWPSRSRSDRDLAYYAPMGSASSVGLGLALARPDVRVIVLDGDGSLLMNLGSLVTIGSWQPANLTHIVLDNGRYAVTGGQPTPTSKGSRLARLAEAAGVPTVLEIDDGEVWEHAVEGLVNGPGCRFAVVKVASQYDRATVAELLAQPAALARHTGAGYWTLRASLGVPDPAASAG